MKTNLFFSFIPFCGACWLASTHAASGQTNFALLGQTNVGGTAEWVEQSGSFVFLANGSDGVRSFYAADPTNPIAVGHINDGDFAYSIAILDHLAYVADGYDTLRIYDVTNPTNMVALGHTNGGGYSFRVVATASNCFVGTLDAGVQIYDVRNPLAPVKLGQTPSGVHGLAVRGNQLFAAQASAGLFIYDVSDPTSPQLLGSASVPYGDTEFVTLQGDYAYVGDAEQGLTLFDISDPTSPKVVNRGQGGNFMSSAAVAGNYVYAATYNALIAYDVTQPTNFLVAAQADTGAAVHNLVRSGSLAFIANDIKGLRAYSLGAPAALQLSISASQSAAGHLALTWPAPSTAFKVQKRDAFTATSWTDLNVEPVVTNGVNQANVPATSAQEFFRLTFP